MSTLCDRRLLIVSGKGGVGRTTTAAALARAAVSRGRRVLLAQMDAPQHLGRMLGHAGAIGPELVTVAPGLAAVNMTSRSALHQYGLMVLRSEALTRALFENKAIRSFLSAVPGLDAYAMLGKAWWHTTEGDAGRLKYDLVIVDAPASGHAVSMLRVPRALLAAMPTGPLARDASAISSMLADPERFAFVIVTLPEQLAVRETAQLARAVRSDLRLPLGPVIINGVPPAYASAPALTAVLARLAGKPVEGEDELGAPLAGTLEAAAILAGRRSEADLMIAELARDPGLAAIQLPRLRTTDLGPAELDELAAFL